MARRSSITPWDLECMLFDETADPKALPLSLLEEITGGFSDELEIGRGGFAVVYKGKLEKRTVAVKRMSDAYMDEMVFQREVECLMMAKHKNVVRFLGYCADRQGSMEKYEGKFVMADVHQRLLCFEYVSKGSLHGYITDASSGLQWIDRYHIIKGVCQGLHYLHKKKIVHLDLKPGNILLDDNFVAKIADFGLSRCFGEMQSRIITSKIVGTLGYLAPEFFNGEITYQFDIYSLGVIIIEILTGKKGYHDVDKVVESWSNVLEISRSGVQLEQVRVCAEIGMKCTDFNPAKRPDTQYIINKLDQTESMSRYIKTGMITSQQGVESLSNVMEKSERDVQKEHVRVCAEIGIECTDFNPAKRPDTQHIINRLDEIETMDGYIKTDMITSQKAEHASNKLHQDTPNTPGEAGSEENASAGTNPCNYWNANLDWLNEIRLDMLSETRRSVWLSYQQLNPDIMRCCEFCSIFPIESKLRRSKLISLWIAQGFVKTSSATEEMEDVAEGYFQELVSRKFLEPDETTDGQGCFTIAPVLHNMLDEVTRNCFRMGVEWTRSPGGLEGDVPQDVQHLCVEEYDAEVITEKILGLKKLLTLIVYTVCSGTSVEEKVIESICKRLPKLRVLAVAFNQECVAIKTKDSVPFSVPKSVCRLKDLRYLAFWTYVGRVILPSTINELQHIQLLDFGSGHIVEFNFGDLINLRHIFCSYEAEPSNISRLTSLQTLPKFTVKNEQGCELKQLRDLNKLGGVLAIGRLANVKSKEEALEANLASKERLTKLHLDWTNNARCSPEVEAEVLEGLCPPVGLEELSIMCYEGSRYPDWMVRKQKGGPKDLKVLQLACCCSQPGPAPQLVQAFPHLRVVWLWKCGWDALPGNMELLTSLKDLKIEQCMNIRSLPTLPRSLKDVTIEKCMNIRSLPTLPQSLEGFSLFKCDKELMESCTTVGSPNWQKIEHIPCKTFW